MENIYESITDSLKCTICGNYYDSSIHVPKILHNCGHTLCAVCINTNITENHNNLTCPEDLILYENITSSDFFPTNSSLLLEIEKTSFTPSFPIKNDFLRKSSTLRSSLKRSVSFHLCSIHSIPLDVICIEDKTKICSQCALSSTHSTHTLVTDEEFMNQIDKLIDMFDEIDTTIKSFTNKNNVSAKDVLSKFNDKINEMIQSVENIVNDVIKSINQQKDNVIRFLNCRSNEIQEKYSKIEFDIKDVITQTNTWKDIVQNKLEKITDIDDPSIECLQLIDDDNNKNQATLLHSGKQLLDRFKFISQTEKNINELKNYVSNGISISPISQLLDCIKDIDINNNTEFNKEKEYYLFPLQPSNTIKPEIIFNNLFIIEENSFLINKLKLVPFTFQTNSKLISLLENSTDKRCSQLSMIPNFHGRDSKSLHVTNSSTPESRLLEDLTNNCTNISEQERKELRKQYKCQQHPRSLATIDENNQINDKGNKITNNCSTFHTSTRGSFNSNLPNRDKIIFIQSQLKNESANFSRVDIGEDEMEYLCNILESLDNKKNVYKEIKFVKSNLNDKSVRKFVMCLINNNIHVKNINFSSNGLSDNCSDIFITMLNKYQYIQTLNLNNNAFSIRTKEKIKSYSTVKKNGFSKVKIFI